MNDVAERVVHDGSPAAKFLDVGRLRGWHAMPAYKLMQVIHDSATGTKPNQLTGIRSQAAWIGVCHADVCPAIPGNGRRITLSHSQRSRVAAEENFLRCFAVQATLSKAARPKELTPHSQPSAGSGSRREQRAGARASRLLRVRDLGWRLPRRRPCAPGRAAPGDWDTLAWDFERGRA